MQFSSILLLSATALGAVAAPALQSETVTTAATTPVTKAYLQTFMKLSMADFLAAKAAKKDPQLVWTDDGCSVPILNVVDPDSANYPEGFEFLKPCQRHDFCYRNFEQFDICSSADRKECDTKFQQDLMDVCKKEKAGSEKRAKCDDLVSLYFLGVRFGGQFVFCK